MQSISPLNPEQLLAKGQESLAKFEIYVGTSWINLCDLDGKDYLEDWSISLGGASMSPAPIGGTWSVTLSNENGIFHPSHPTSAYKTYLVTGRKVRLSTGGKYGGTDYYWQRITGYMEEPSFDIDNAKVNINGSDYMKFLQDTELKSPDNYWGTPATFDSIASDGIVGSEIYAEADAMDINNEGDNVTNWTPTNCTFVSIADAGGGSSYVGKAVVTAEGPASVINTAVGTVEAGKEYLFKFKYKRVSGNGELDIRVLQNSTYLGGTSKLIKTSYTEASFHFKAASSGSVKIRLGFESCGANDEFRVDQFSIFKFIPYYERYYELPAACKGPYRVLLDSEDVWQGEEDEGWYYEESTRRVFFDINKTVANGSNNLVIYYFTTQPLEDVVADLLVTAGLYANQAAAKADMDYTDPAVDIDQVWFDAGTAVLDAIRKICERCDYRFYFSYAGKPVFKPKPSPGSTAFTFSNQKHVASVRRYEDRAEIKNRIVIEGKEQAEPVNKEETVPPKLRGEAYNQTSIDNYGERTMTIKNHLFQDQTSIDNMCSSLLAEYKDPKWYIDINTPYNPVPLEMGDKISFKERLSPSLEITEEGIIRDLKISKFNSTYRNEAV